jgi:hypothetical protein
LLLPCDLPDVGLEICTGLFWSPGLKSVLFPEGCLSGFAAGLVEGFASGLVAGLVSGLAAGLAV